MKPDLHYSKIDWLIPSRAILRLPRWLSGKESTCQHRRCRFNPWVQKIPWRRKWQPTLVFLLKNPMDRGEGWSLWDLKEARHDLTTKQQRQGNHISKKLWHLLSLSGGRNKSSVQHLDINYSHTCTQVIISHLKDQVQSLPMFPWWEFKRHPQFQSRWRVIFRRVKHENDFI